MNDAMLLDRVVDIFRQALYMTMELSLPLLAVGLVVGLTISLFQAVTQIQEQTLTLIPKILAVVGALVLLLPTMLRVTLNYTSEMLTNLDYLWGGSF